MKKTQELASRKYKKRSQIGETWHRLRKNKGAVIGLILILIIVLIAVSSQFVFDFDTQIAKSSVRNKLKWPSIEHPLGTDELGRDVLYRLLYATKDSVMIGFVACCVAAVIGVIIGAVAAYFGGVVENIIMRIVDIFAAIPTLLLAIVIVAALGQSTLNLMLSIGIAGVPTFARVTRGAVLGIKNNQYVEAAKAIGENEFTIIFKHILRNCLSPIIVQFTLKIGSSIISASSLSFLGMGVKAPSPEWGGMLSTGRQFIRSSSYLTLFPGLAIMITVLAFNMIGDGLRDALDPKLKK